MHYLLEYVFECVFPPSEDTRIVRALTHKEVLRYYTPHDTRDTTALMSYRERTVRALIHEAKFHGNTHATVLLGSVLSRYLASLRAPLEFVIIPMPLSRVRFRARGYNQVSEILRAALAHDTFPYRRVHTDVLMRTRNTTPQTGLARTRRLSNVDGAFVVKNPDQIRGAHVLLIDDVLTTGATMRAARKALLTHAPKSVRSIALAH